MIANRLALAGCGSRALSARNEGIAAPALILIQKRNVHESYIPSGSGGRSSFSGIVATVFGGSGFIGRICLNRLAKHGASVVVAHRSPYQYVRHLRPMFDLGQLLMRDFCMEDSDDRIRELVQHSNCVVNLIGSNKPYQNCTLEKANLEWPLRLAKIVAEKNDGTRLLHITKLNCNHEFGRKTSKLLQLDYAAEVGIREIYPEAIIARSSNVFGYNSTYTNFFVHERQEDLGKFGGMPLLYDGGKSTIIQPIYSGDLGEGLARILKHLDSPGKTFELYGPRRYVLKDYVEYIYKIMDKPCYLYDTLGPMDSSKANFVQKKLQKLVTRYFEKQEEPRFLFPRAVDVISRLGTPLESWATKDYFDMIHVTDNRTGLPGLEQLGIEPTPFEDKSMLLHGYLHLWDSFTIQSKHTLPNIKQQSTYLPRVK
uniref:NADH dehydrogenase [ubiquinone] 1 alpha subcomplex subunit 9, mitochondrial-like n=1 Tax=Styela clava TaxID=7725 RepID=UPI00193A2BAA|nr:NADH dehydrogenase [ubiquinone] 1 alpha subcomplex subunit 9, mitochondrial-like [Styela clava]